MAYTLIKKPRREFGFNSESGGAFTWAAGVGYVFNNKIEVSARYQTGGQEGVNVGNVWFKGWLQFFIEWFEIRPIIFHNVIF